MIKPTVHFNGTSRERLSAAYVAADEAIRSAMEALREAEPNGRDYYTQGAAAVHTAIREHNARMEKLRSVRVDLQELIEHVER